MMRKLVGGVVLSLSVAGMVPLDEVASGGHELPSPESGGQLPAPEMEDLLHFAIRNSNLTKLREMAEAGRMPTQSIDDLIEAFAETDRVLRETVTKTLVEKDWESEAELLAGLQLIEDYGDHLVDKGDMLHKMGALGPMLDWLASFRVTEMYTTQVGEKLAMLLVEMTQNRETTQQLVLELRPGILQALGEAVTGERHKCLGNRDGNEDMCAAWVSAISSLIGHNQEVQSALDDSVFVPLASALTRLDIGRPLFQRLISTFRVLTITQVREAKWMHALDLNALIEKSETGNVFMANKVLELVQRVNSVANKPRIGNLLVVAKTKLFIRCMEVYEQDEEVCLELKPSVDLDHSSEL